MNSELTAPHLDVLVEVLLASPDMDVFLNRLVTISAQTLSQGLPAGHCSVTLWRKGRPFTVASSDPETAGMDEVQYSSNQGPCLQALKTGLPVEVTDLRTETRWPAYTAAVARGSLRSVFAVPMSLKSSGAAALNCYSPLPGPLVGKVKEALVDFATVAARAVMLSVELQAHADMSAGLATIGESRTAINLAVGVVMAQTGCGQQQAVETMMKASNNHNEKLKDVALSIIGRFNGTTTTTRFDAL